MKPALPVVVLLAAAALAQPDRLRIGEIEFYGYAGLDLNAVRATNVNASTPFGAMANAA